MPPEQGQGLRARIDTAAVARLAALRPCPVESIDAGWQLRGDLRDQLAGCLQQIISELLRNAVLWHPEIAELDWWTTGDDVLVRIYDRTRRADGVWTPPPFGGEMHCALDAWLHAADVRDFPVRPSLAWPARQGRVDVDALRQSGARLWELPLL